MFSEEQNNFQNDISKLNTEGVNQLVNKITLVFKKDLLKMNQIYQQNIETKLDQLQCDYLLQYSEKSQLLQWILSKIGELPQFSQYESQIEKLASERKSQLCTGLQAQKKLLIGLIDQISQNFQFEISKDDTSQDKDKVKVIARTTTEKLTCKLTCLICDKQELEVASLRKHLRNFHFTDFQGFSCKDCNFHCRGLEEFSDHKIKVHQNKICMCDKSFPSKQQFCEHLRSCLSSYKKCDGLRQMRKSRITPQEHKSPFE